MRSSFEEGVTLDDDDVETSTNPLMSGLNGEDQTTTRKLFARFMSFIRRPAEENRRPDNPFAMPFAAPPPPPSVQVTNTKGWSNGAMAIIVVIMVVVMFVVVIVAVTEGNGWAKVEKLGTTATSLFTRYAALQQHRPIAAYFDAYGDTISSESVRTETATGPKSFARITGSVDLASMRLDWSIQVVDSHIQLDDTMTVVLWVQKFDPTTHLMVHVPHSPLKLCSNVQTSKTCSGSMDHPAVELSTSESDPRVFSLAIYKGAIVDYVSPLWVIPVE